MSRSYPKSGSFYTVVDADDIVKIASWAYSDSSKTKKIIDANKSLLYPRIQSGRIHADRGGIPIVYVGDKLWIPPKEERQPRQQPNPLVTEIPASYPEEIAIKIDDKIFRGWTTNSIERAINTIADSFSFTAPFDYTDEDSSYLDPYTYHKCDLYIGGNLFMTGVAEKWDPKTSEDVTTTTISVRSKGGVLVDCNAPDQNLTYTKQTLKEIADNILEPFGIQTEIPYGDTGKIKVAKRNVQDKIFNFIAELSKKFGFIINSTFDGKLKFDRANTSGESILNLVQGKQPLLEVTASYDGSKRFSKYTANSQSRGKPKNTSTVEDDSIPVLRPIIFDAKDTEEGNIQDSAKWAKSRALSSSATISAKVNGWRDKNNNIILENNIITLKSPNVHIYQETKFLIEKVSYSQQGGRSATLSLALPEAYTLDFPSSFPWSR